MRQETEGEGGGLKSRGENYGLAKGEGPIRSLHQSYVGFVREKERVA